MDIYKTGVYALVTKYFNKKVTPWWGMEECGLRFYLELTHESVEAKNLIFIVWITLLFKGFLQHACMHAACYNNIWSQYDPFDPGLSSVLNFWPTYLEGGQNQPAQATESLPPLKGLRILTPLPLDYPKNLVSLKWCKMFISNHYHLLGLAQA